MLRSGQKSGLEQLPTEISRPRRGRDWIGISAARASVPSEATVFPAPAPPAEVDSGSQAFSSSALEASSI